MPILSDNIYTPMTILSDNIYIPMLILSDNICIFAENKIIMYKFRKKYKSIFEHVKRKEFTIITGARQTGKTTILKQIYSELRLNNENVWLLSFENNEILTNINKEPENLFKYILRPKNPIDNDDHKPSYVLIDEIQYANNPTNFLKYLYDTYAPNLKIVATGSSAFYIDTKFKDSLVGRKKIFTLSTLNFEEFLIFNDFNDLAKELLLLQSNAEYLSLKRNELQQLFDVFITYGGYPAVVLLDDVKEKKDMLKEIKDSYIKRDIYDSRIENQDTFYKLLVILASQTGSMLNRNELSKTLQSHLKTIDKYLYVLQKSFHISLLKPYYNNYKKEITKMPKVFFNDLGLRNILLNNFSEVALRKDKGELLENYVFLRLNELFEDDEIRFWRTLDQKEIDFVISCSNSEVKAFEVKFNSLKIKKSKYKKFGEIYPNANLQFVTYYNNSEDNNIGQVLKL